MPAQSIEHTPQHTHGTCHLPSDTGTQQTGENINVQHTTHATYDAEATHTAANLLENTALLQQPERGDDSPEHSHTEEETDTIAQIQNDTQGDIQDRPHDIWELETAPIETQARQIYEQVKTKRSTHDEPTVWGTVINANGINNMYKGDSLAIHTLRGDWDVIHITVGGH